jgi:hypothetical protein
MLIKFKVIKSNRNEWLGWFGEDLIKVRIDCSINNDMQSGLISFLQKDLGINNDKFKVLRVERDFFTIEFPDVAWELFLTAIK